jgi:hypothetical protein
MRRIIATYVALDVDSRISTPGHLVDTVACPLLDRLLVKFAFSVIQEFEMDYRPEEFLAT